MGIFKWFEREGPRLIVPTRRDFLKAAVTAAVIIPATSLMPVSGRSLVPARLAEPDFDFEAVYGGLSGEPQPFKFEQEYEGTTSARWHSTDGVDWQQLYMDNTAIEIEGKTHRIASLNISMDRYGTVETTLRTRECALDPLGAKPAEVVCLNLVDRYGATGLSLRAGLTVGVRRGGVVKPTNQRIDSFELSRQYPDLRYDLRGRPDAPRIVGRSEDQATLRIFEHVTHEGDHQSLQRLEQRIKARQLNYHKDYRQSVWPTKTEEVE